MNLYVRYFNHETLATNIDEIVAFLSTIHEITVDDAMVERILHFVESESVYPFRLKVSYSNYVLFLKTEATNLEEFRQMERQHKQQEAEGRQTLADKKRSIMEQLSTRNPGWYDASLTFKRVVQNPVTGKCQYVDTRFRVRLRAESPMDCYDRVVTHLQNRQDVDARSQFPSAKNANFEYSYLGMELPDEAS